MLSPELILQAAQDFVEQFKRSVQAYSESNRDERFKPCMSQAAYADKIYSLIEARHNRPIYHDKNNVYQVLFAVSCLMGLPDHKRSWWEQTFAERTQEYLERTTLFQGSRQKIQDTIRKINSLLQYELDFASTNPVQTAVQQTLDLFSEMEEVHQCILPKVKPKRRKPAPRSKPNSLQLHLHFHDKVENVIAEVNSLKFNEQ